MNSKFTYDSKFSSKKTSCHEEFPFIKIQQELKTDRTASQYSNMRSNRSKNLNNDHEIHQLKTKILQLEGIIKTQEKEISSLKKLNEYLQLANHSKIKMLNTERLQNISKPIRFEQAPIERTESPKKLAMTSTHSLSQIITNITKKQRNSSPNRRSSMKKITMKVMKEEESSNRVHQQFSNFMTIEECFKINSILNLDLNDGDAISLYENDGGISFVEKILEDEDIFMELLQYSDLQKLSFLYDKLKKIQQEHKQLFVQVLRLKKIIQGAIQMSKSVLLDECISTIIDQIVYGMDCDRASCFIVDHSKNELWSKVAKGTSKIFRFPLDKGIAGHVASHNEVLNIKNAYLDPRFNKEFDLVTNYKTKNILACPISDRGKCIGVLQCLNKVDGPFTTEDEQLLNILARFSNILLSKAFNHDEQLLTLNKLKYTVDTGLQLNQNVNNLKELLINSQQRLRTLMNCEYSKVAIINKQTNLLEHYSEDGEKVEHDWRFGIMGECLKTQKKINIFNCYNHPLFNPIVDIPSQMPVILAPIYSCDNNLIGGIEVINVKGIGTLLRQSVPLVSPIDQEIIEFFIKQLAQCIEINSQLEL